MKDLAVATKYAHALFAEAQAKGQLLACQQGLDEVMRVVQKKPLVERVWSHPFIPLEEKRTLVRAVLGKFATPLLERFFVMLIERGRVASLVELVRKFRDFVDRHQGIEPVRVSLPFALSETQQKALQAKLEKLLGAKVRMETVEDPSLLGGLIVRTRDHVIDQSLKGQLEKLEKQLSA